MKPEKLRKVLLLGENQNVEYKSNCRSIDAIGATVCGFLNSGGGFVVCGVNDEGNICGIATPDTATEKMDKALQLNISPKSLISISIQTVENKPLAVIEVPAGKDIPYAYKDGIYVRERERTRKADVETIRDMVLRKSVEPDRWERRFSTAEPESDMDVQELRTAVASTRKARGTFFRNPENPLMVLEDLSVARYGRLTQGGDVLFCKNPATRYPQVRVRAACFSRDRASDTFRDMKSFEGPLVSVLEQVFDFIIRNTPTVSRFLKNNLQRQDESLYPSEAIREGLINAFAHRDYADFSGGIAVHIYPTRLEIWNSGSLPEGITPGTLAKGHLSVLRNPDIAHVLYLRGLMEKLGRGSVLIIQSCTERGLPKPSWISDEKSGVTLTFYAPEVTPEVRLLSAIKGEMTRQEIQGAVGLKDDEHFRKKYLLPALESGLLEMTIPDKPRSSRQKYRLTRKGLEILELPAHNETAD